MRAEGAGDATAESSITTAGSARQARIAFNAAAGPDVGLTRHDLPVASHGVALNYRRSAGFWELAPAGTWRPAANAPFSCGDQGTPDLRPELNARWILVPSLTIEHSPCFLFPGSTPLLKEEGHALLAASRLQFPYPFAADRPRGWPGLPPNNGPMNFGKINWTNRTDQRLERDEAYRRRSLPQPINSPYVIGTLDRCSEPDVWEHCKFLIDYKFTHSRWTFRKDLKRVPMSLPHDVPDPSDDIERHILMEQITHGVDEDPLWPRPSQGRLQRTLVDVDPA